MESNFKKTAALLLALCFLLFTPFSFASADGTESSAETVETESPAKAVDAESSTEIGEDVAPPVDVASQELVSVDSAEENSPSEFSSDGNEVIANETGVSVNVSDAESSVSVSVGDIVSEETGVSVSSAAEGGSVVIETGEISASGAGVSSVAVAGDVSVSVDGNISSDGAAVDVYTGSGSTTVSVNGDAVSAETAVVVTSEGGDTTVSVAGDVQAAGTGIQIISLGGTTEVSSVGSVVSDSSGVSCFLSQAEAAVSTGEISAGETGISLETEESVASVTVSGDISSSDAGIQSTGYLSVTDISVDGSVSSEANGIVTDSAMSETSIDVKGSVEAGESGVSSDNMLGHSSVVIAGDVTAGGDGIVTNTTFGETEISVSGDIRAGQAGVVFGGAEGVTDMLVEGTITGDEIGIRLGETVNPESTSLTVWKIDTNKEGAVAEATSESAEEQTALAESFSKAILYIVRLLQPEEGGNLSATDAKGSSLGTSHNHEVAQEGDVIRLNITLDEGYEVVGAYNGESEEKVALQQDEQGFFYTVQRGGGILLSAILQKIKAPEPAYTGSSSSEESWYSAYVPVLYNLDGGRLDDEGGVIRRFYPVWQGSIPLPEAPVKEGFRFIGWQLVPEAGEAIVLQPGELVPFQYGLEFTALWEEI